MRAFRVKKKVSDQGAIQLDGLPFAVGETVEIIVLGSSEEASGGSVSKIIPSLKGSVLEYVDPTEPVAEDDNDCRHGTNV